MLAHYVFYDQHDKVLYMGYHSTEKEAWDALLNKYSDSTKKEHIEKIKQTNIYFTKSSW